MMEKSTQLYQELRIQQAGNRELLKIIKSEMESARERIDAAQTYYKSLEDKLSKTLDDLQLQGEIIDSMALAMNQSA